MIKDMVAHPELQLRDLIDSYLESSATAIYAYSIAHGINEGWLNPLEYGPAFYYYRPVSPYAAHAYGPAVFAGAEIIRLVENFHPRMNDSAVQFYREDYSDKGPIFSVNVK